MPNDSARCHDCGAAFVPDPGESRCAACRRKREKLAGLIGGAVERGQRNIDDIARSTGLSPRQVSKTLQTSNYLRHAAESNETCVQCGERPAQQGSPFCLACRLALYKSLGDAASETERNQKGKKKRAKSGMESGSTMAALSEKRRKTGSHRFNPAPSQRKGYR